MGIDLTLRCAKAEVETASSTMVVVTLNDVYENDLDRYVFDVIDVDAFCEHHGIERAEK